MQSARNGLRGGNVKHVDNLGAPVAYLVLSNDVPVYDRSGDLVGHVAKVLADEAADIFHGLIIALPGKPTRYRFADPSQIAGLYGRGVTLTVTADQLHEPSEDAVAAKTVGSESVREGLRRAWEWLNRAI
jgi:hypothetical protein